MDLADDAIDSQVVWDRQDAAELEDAVDAAKDARIVIMNPPFTNRAKVGEKFPNETQRALRSRVDDMENILVRNDEPMDDFTDKNSIRPLFVALADKCLPRQASVLVMINPTIALCAPSGLNERRILAERYHIHTVLTCHQPGNVNLSQNAGINESIIVLRRHKDRPKPPTRFINLDRLPIDDDEVDDLHSCLLGCQHGQIANGWGEVSYWPAERIEAGDWTPAIWRSPELAEAARQFADNEDMKAFREIPNIAIHKTGATLYGPFERSEIEISGSFPVLASKGAKGQTSITSTPDEYWIPKKNDKEMRLVNGGIHQETKEDPRKSRALVDNPRSEQ